jgi:hypothetical protein
VAAVAQVLESSAVENYLVSGILGGSVVGSLGFLLLKGVLAQLKQYGELVVSYQNRENNLLAEHAQLGRINEEQRRFIDETRIHLDACRKENEIVNKRMETMALEILDLKGKIKSLEDKNEEI